MGMWNLEVPRPDRWLRSVLASSRDPRQARFLTPQSLAWVVRNRAVTPWYLARYYRFAMLKLRHPEVVTEGFVFLGKNVELRARPGYGRIILGPWVHIGDHNCIRCHEGTLRIGPKAVLGKDNVLNCYLDIELGESTLISDWVYVADFNHVHTDIHMPIKDQGIVKAPVRIGPDCWIGAKASVLSGTTVGRGCVVGAHSVVNKDVPDYSVVVGVPARVVRDRKADYDAAAETREAIEDIARKTARASAAYRGALEGHDGREPRHGERADWGDGNDPQDRSVGNDSPELDPSQAPRPATRRGKPVSASAPSSPGGVP